MIIIKMSDKRPNISVIIPQAQKMGIYISFVLFCLFWRKLTMCEAVLSPQAVQYIRKVVQRFEEQNGEQNYHCTYR